MRMDIFDNLSTYCRHSLWQSTGSKS